MCSESVGAVVAAQSDVAKLRRFYKIWNARTQIGFESVPTEKNIYWKNNLEASHLKIKITLEKKHFLWKNKALLK